MLQSQQHYSAYPLYMSWPCLCRSACLAGLRSSCVHCAACVECITMPSPLWQPQPLKQHKQLQLVKCLWAPHVFTVSLHVGKVHVCLGHSNSQSLSDAICSVYIQPYLSMPVMKYNQTGLCNMTARSLGSVTCLSSFVNGAGAAC